MPLLVKVIVILYLIGFPAYDAAYALAEDVKVPADVKPLESEAIWWREIKDGFDYSLRGLTFGTFQDKAGSSQNPNNGFFQLPRHTFDIELRPDLYFHRKRLDLSAKPRVNLEWKKWKEGGREGESDWDDDWFLNEWLARVRIAENLFVSYGRENLQWGPSYLLSPSNPFFRDNGRSNPKQEVAGMDFGRVVWLPGEGWTISLIGNMSKGHQKDLFGGFEKTYSLKVDFTGREAYGSLVLSHRESDRDQVGAFGGWTATDAFLLYAEGAVSRGTNALYPREADSPFGATMEATEFDSSSLKETLLIGASYTLELGPTLTFEFVHNNLGYTDSESDAYYDLRRNASEALSQPGLTGNLALFTLSRTFDPGLRLRRRHYAMLQYSHNDIRDVLNVLGRWTQNIEDGSGQFISIVEYYLGDHIQLFSIGTVNSGGGDTEFGSILDYQWMIGLEYTF